MTVAGAIVEVEVIAVVVAVIEIMRDWYNGCALAFQASEAGSTPASRFSFGVSYE